MSWYVEFVLTEITLQAFRFDFYSQIEPCWFYIGSFNFRIDCKQRVALYFVFLNFIELFTNLFFLCSFSVNTGDGCSRQLKYILKLIKVLSLWYVRFVLRFLNYVKKKLFRNLDLSTLKLERKKSHLMIEETCYT